MIYEPSDDSFLLEKWVKKIVKPGMKVLDVGCGSGIQSLAAKKGDVLAVDINLEAVKVVKELGFNAIQSDLFENVNDKFDLIIFNPPYLPDDESEDKESKLITTGGKQGFEILIEFFKEVKSHLNKKGKILIVISSLTQPKKVEDLIKKQGLKFKVLDSKKLFMEKLFVCQINPALLKKSFFLKL